MKFRTGQAWWRLAVIIALETLRQEGPALRANLDYSKTLFSITTNKQKPV